MRAVDSFIKVGQRFQPASVRRRKGVFSLAPRLAGSAALLAANLRREEAETTGARPVRLLTSAAYGSGVTARDFISGSSYPGFPGFDHCGGRWYQMIVPKTPPERLDRCWRKSRIAARILLREEQGRLTARDVRIGRKLATDPDVTARLIDQAIYGIRGRQARLERESRAAA
ncbi:MAG: hypothetical protein L0Z50_21550 [Verrucomicrobiales bacterium]|nr:hypothetical protein [Verrucomicrobiales bacterium]